MSFKLSQVFCFLGIFLVAGARFRLILKPLMNLILPIKINCIGYSMPMTCPRGAMSQRKMTASVTPA